MGAYEWRDLMTVGHRHVRWQFGLPLLGIAFVVVGVMHVAKVLVFDGATRSVR